MTPLSTSEQKGRRKGRIALVVVPPDPGRKSSHLVLVKHHGGGWYRAQCMGEAKRCVAGECRHVAHLQWENGRRIRPEPRHQASGAI